ncbi:hypothetical protein GGTG_05020 [Gaeumannomyces tritici R3-111a-1]|uniref:Uncharacterized protein n=1 Tax=Gaeumannomyces tritici (strain R3-111a-1) TaxID=644352 RepID=J3NUR4_GAET3|nr:hypothetical protein GGTG_05020 [Gaeumannomyces tritici R3-111a-1]EJT79938.1 hypothetical protein GGTG_05020 [Gaeumannomyces tritici R3-111a-1]
MLWERLTEQGIRAGSVAFYKPTDEPAQQSIVVGAREGWGDEADDQRRQWESDGRLQGGGRSLNHFLAVSPARFFFSSSHRDPVGLLLSEVLMLLVPERSGTRSLPRHPEPHGIQHRTQHRTQQSMHPTAVSAYCKTTLLAAHHHHGRAEPQGQAVLPSARLPGKIEENLYASTTGPDATIFTMSSSTFPATRVLFHSSNTLQTTPLQDPGQDPVTGPRTEPNSRTQLGTVPPSYISVSPYPADI